jgi:hypothetical protein
MILLFDLTRFLQLRSPILGLEESNIAFGHWAGRLFACMLLQPLRLNFVHRPLIASEAT